MNVLLVDDLRAIVDSLKNGVNWKTAGVEKLYTACSAKEAKLLLMNFEIDVLICDIEMPEENGLELAAWVKEHLDHVECIFLTAHAEFDYIQKAMHIGGFDYILQPVKFKDVEEALDKVRRQVRKKQQERKLLDITRKAFHQKSEILKIMLGKIAQNKESEANQICREYREMCSYYFGACAVYQAILSLVRWKRITSIRKPDVVEEELANILASLFEENTAKTTVVNVNQDSFWIMVFAREETVTEEVWRRKLNELYQFVKKNMEYEIAIFPAMISTKEDYVWVFQELAKREKQNTGGRTGIFEKEIASGPPRKYNPAIEEALLYIEKRMNKNISRGEVAQAVHLSEEYFSKLFKQETGDTFKDYILAIKMKAAMDFLEKTQLSVGIVASKVGYSNFSYFSQTFKNYTGLTPQEYRKTKKKNT